MIFDPEVPPRNRADFMAWYHRQTQWAEGHSYDDPSICTPAMQRWFKEMIQTFPALNGPYAIDDPDNMNASDYCIGKEVIYVAFAWSVAEQAYETMKAMAGKHRVGFFDVSANDGGILFPDADGKNSPIDRPDNLSSVKQIKNSAGPGQENSSVKEIIFSRIDLSALENSAPKKKWWQFWK